jgi:hypothetical protein
MEFLPSRKRIASSALLWRLGCRKCLACRMTFVSAKNSDSGDLSAEHSARFCQAAMLVAGDDQAFGTIFA